MDQATFDRKITEQVNKIGKQNAALIGLVEGDPGMMGEERMRKVFGFLAANVEAMRQKAAIAVQLSTAASGQFSLDMEVPEIVPAAEGAPAATPGRAPRIADPNYTRKAAAKAAARNAEVDGAGFIDET